MNVPDWLRDALAVLRRPEQIGGNEWAERFRVLGEDEHGQLGRGPILWRSFAWQEEILDALADPGLTRITILKAAQMGVSELVRNAIGRWALYDPGDVLWVMADEHAATKAMKRLKALFTNTPSLRPLLSAKRSDKKLLELILTNGMRIVVGWAGSASSLASEPFRYVILDEVAKYRWHVQGEGSPVSLAEERTKIFGRRGKIILLSTPKHEDDQICKAHRETLDRRAFHVACPACGHLQVAELETLRWPGGSVATAPAEADARVRLAAAIRRDRSAWVECSSCRGKVQPSTAQNAGARWAQEEEVEGDDRRAFHVTEFVHWETTASDLAARWLRCTHPKELSEFWNGSLGLPFKSTRTQIPAAVFTGRARYPAKLVPAWATTVLSTADTQGLGWWYMVRAWAARGRSRLLDWGWADTEEQMLDRCVHARFPVEGAPDLEASPFAFGVDTGGGMKTPDGSRTKEVYDLVHRTKRAYAIKGRGDKESNDGAPWTLSKVRLDDKGREIPLHLLNRNHYADEAAALIRATEPEVLWQESEAVTDDYARQMASEELVLVTSGSSSLWLWQKRSKGAPNHLWDCFDEETEVLTRDGFRRFGELAGDELLATVDIKTDLIEYQRPTAMIRRHHAGDMVKIGGGPRQRVDMLVTPGHRMVVLDGQGAREWTIKQASDLTIWDKIKTRAAWAGRTDAPDLGVEVSAKDLAEFLGWYVSEGYCEARANPRNKTSISRRVHICQRLDGPWAPALRALLGRLPWNHHVTGGRAFTITNKALYELVQPLGGSGEKRVPQWIKDAEPAVIEAFIRGAVYGDGWEHKGHEAYATTSPQLADDMVELYLKVGFGASVIRRAGKPWMINGRSGLFAREQFHVHRRTAGPASLRDGKNKPNFSLVHYDGEVFCATVPNGTLIVRRNGKVAIAGNCARYQVWLSEIARVDSREKPTWLQKVGAGRHAAARAEEVEEWRIGR